MPARLEAITGSMFCGKSEELVRRLVRARYAEKRILVVTPKLDTRPERNILDIIAENDKLKIYDRLKTAIVGNLRELTRLVEQSRPDVVAIDEGQFFSKALPTTLSRMLANKSSSDFTIIVSGLDQDYKGRGFGPMPGILAQANDVQKLTAICNACKREIAYYTYRLPGGSKERIELGDTDRYQARCLTCWLLPE